MSFSKVLNGSSGSGKPLQEIYDINNPLCDVKEIIDGAAKLLYNQILETLDIRKDTILQISHFVSLASSLVSFVSSLIAAVKTSVTGYVRVALYMAPVASLVGVVASISSLLTSIQSKQQVEFSVDHAYQTITNITSTLQEQSQAPVPNSLGSAEYLHYGIGLVGIILTAGLAKFTFAPKDINTWLSMREHVSRFTSDVEGFMKDLIEKVFKIDLTQDLAFSNKLHSVSIELEEMLKTPSTTFILDRSSYDRLQACVKSIQQISEMKFTSEQARRYSQMRSVFATGYAKLLETIRVISSVVDASIRPTGIGIVFQGAPGIGKSEFAQYILKQVGRAMRYSQKIYNIKPGPSGNYYEIYSGESLGIYNEFCASRQDNSGINKMNEVLSSDPCNLEAADVGYKHQPCKLTLVAFTANKSPNSYYDFTNQMTEDANIALMTRLIRIQVTDPLFTSRQEENPHRMPDFSHLVLHALKPVKPSQQITSLSDYANNRLEPVTLDELTNTLIQKCAANEMHYIRKVLAQIPELPEDIVQGLKQRVQQLTEIQKFNATSEDNNEAEPRSTHKLPHVVRIQGPIHTGKTEMVMQVASAISGSLALPVEDITGFTEPPDSDNPKIYILDDIPHGEYLTEQYTQWLNKVHRQSMVLIVTNKIYPVKDVPLFSFRRLLLAFSTAYDSPASLMLISFWIRLYRAFMDYSESYFDMSDIPDPELGYVRRLGISGMAKLDSFKVVPGKSLCITTHNTSSVHIGLQHQQATNLNAIVMDSYYDHLRANYQFSIVHAEAPHVEPDVNVEVRDFALYSQEIMSPQGCLSMFLNENHPAAKITVTKEKQDFILKSSNVASWVMPCQPKADTFLQSVIPNLKRLVALCPGIVVRMSYANKVFVYQNGILYSSVRLDMGVEMRDGLLYVGDKSIMCGPAALYYTRGMAALDDATLAPYTGTELVAVKNYLEASYANPELHHYRAAIESQQQMMREAAVIRRSHQLVEFFTTPSPARSLVIGFGAVFATITAGMGLYKLVKMLMTTHDDDPCPNSISPPDSLSKRHSERLSDEYVAHVMGGKNRNTSTFIEEKIQSGEHPARMAKWDRYRAHDHATNSTVQPNATLQQIDAFRKRMSGESEEVKQKFEELVSKIPIDNVPCSVHLNDVITKSDTMLSNMRAKLERATLVVRNGDGRNYGLLIKDRFFITVAHAGDIGDPITIIWSANPEKPGKIYKAKVIARAPEKDIMLCEVEDPTFPATRDITRDLVSMYERSDWSGQAIYMRSIPGGETFFGTGTYLGKRSVGLKSSLDPKWNPDDYITYSTYSFDSAFGVHRQGDCGLPLISIINNKPFIVGIHNSVTTSGGANFSPTFREEILSVITSDATTPNNVTVSFSPAESSIPTMEGLKSVPNYNQMLSDLRETTIWKNHPEIPVVGYCHKLKMFSKPSFHKQLVYNEINNEFPLIVKPSPLTVKDLAPQAREFLPKDMRGVPSPLLAQTKKFFHPHKMAVDEATYHQAKAMHLEMMKAYISSVRLLRNHEMINGILDGNLKPVDLSTSAGPYFKAMHRINTKRPLFINHNEGDPTKPQVLGFARTAVGEELSLQVESIKQVWSEAQGVVVMIKDNPKVELLPICDVEEEGKIRLFCEMDVALNLALRCVLGDYISKSHQFHHSLPSRLGFNPFTFPQSYMTQFPGERVSFATDIKRLDKNYPVELIVDFFEMVAELAEDPRHKLMLLGASKSLDRTVHIQDGVLYIVKGGNPSGVVGTTPLNCFLGDRVAMYIYVKWANQSGLRHNLFFSTFIKTTALATYGDDQLWMVDKQCDIGMEHILAGFREFGLEIVPSKNFEPNSVEFCSRQMVFDRRHCVWVSRLKKESIIGGLYYLDTTRRDLIPQQLGMVMFEASMWDEQFYDKIKKEVMIQIAALNLNKLDFKFFSWTEQRSHFARYVRGEERCPIITEIGTEDMDVSPYEQRYLRDKIYTMPEYVIAYYDRCKAEGDTTPISRTHSHRSVFEGDTRTFYWHVHLAHSNHTGTGEDVDLAQALRLAFEDLYINRFGQRIDADTVFPTARSTSFNLRYTHVTAPDDASTYWALHSDETLIADGEVEQLQDQGPGPDLTDVMVNVMNTPAKAAILHNAALSTTMSPDTRMREHSHVCVKCSRTYMHTHPFRHPQHQQRPGQCPNMHCAWAGTMSELARTRARLI